MPLYDLSYRRFDGSRTPRFARPVAMALSQGKLLLKRRSFLLLLGLSWIPVIVRAAQIYFVRQFPEAFPFVTIDALLWHEFLSQQVVFLPVLLVALYTGAGAIASDLSTGAFVIFLSKPISRTDYVIGKAIPVLASLLLVTLVPALVLLTVEVFITEGLDLFDATPLLPISLIGYSVWMCLYFTLGVLAVSSLARSPRVAGAGFGALALGSKVVFLGALSRLRLDAPPSFLSMIDATVDSGHVFFGNPSAAETPFVSLASMALSMVGAGLVLRWRLGSAEASS